MDSRKPKEILLERLANDVGPVLTEKHGFSFSPSQLKFSRTVKPFTQTIEACIDSKYSERNHCLFWTIFRVRSRAFKAWQVEQWGKELASDWVWWTQDCNVAGWERPDDNPVSLCLINEPANDVKVAEILTRNIETLAIPLMDRMSDYEQAAGSFADGTAFDHAVDLYMMAGNTEAARELLELEIPQYEDSRLPHKQDTYRCLKARWDKFFAARA